MRILYVALFLSSFLSVNSSIAEVKAVYNNNTVEVSWMNPLHVEIDYFIIERSKKGRYYKEILKVDGPKKNLESTIAYKEIDSKPFSKTGFYRIKQVDINGNVYYSNAVFAKNYDYVKPIFSLLKQSSVSKNLKGYQNRDILVVLLNTEKEEFIAKVDLIEEGKKLIVTNCNIVLPTGNYIVTATSDDLLFGKTITSKGNYHTTPVYTQNK